MNRLRAPSWPGSAWPSAWRTARLRRRGGIAPVALVVVLLMLLVLLSPAAPAAPAGAGAGASAGASAGAGAGTGAGAAAPGLVHLLEDPRRCAESIGLSPQRPLTLDIVISRVICNFPAVRRSPGLAQQAQAVLDRSLAADRPSLTFFAGVDAEIESSSGAEATLDLEWILFDFGSRAATRREARQALAATLSEQRMEVLNAVAESAELYGLALLAAGRVGAATQNLQTAQDSLRVAGARAAGGAATAAEKMLAQTALAQARFDLTRETNLALTAQGSLAIAMGLSANVAIVVPPPESQGSLLGERIDLERLAQEAREIHPGVIASRERLAQTLARIEAIDAEKGGRIGLNVRTGRERFSGESSIRSSTLAALGWSVPIFDRSLIETRVREARGDALLREAGIAEARQRVELQVWQEGRGLIGELDLLSDSGAVLDSAETALAVVSARYREGVGRFTDVLAAQTAVATARFQIVEARANIRRAQLRLAAALGRLGPLVFD